MSSSVQSYRAGVAGMLLNAANELLLINIGDEHMPHRLDAPKGGMEAGETEEQTLHRELREELGNNIRYDIIGRSSLMIGYVWPASLQAKYSAQAAGIPASAASRCSEHPLWRGQCRVSFWCRYLGGDIQLEEGMLYYHWIPRADAPAVLAASGFPAWASAALLAEWDAIAATGALPAAAPLPAMPAAYLPPQ